MPDSQPRLARSAGMFGLATMASRILGLIRDQVLAYYFGAGDAMDAFRVAFRVPNLVRDLFAEGAMSAAFVPTFTQELTQHGRERAWRLANSVINALILVTLLLVVVGFVFTEPIMRLFGGAYEEVPGKFDLAVQLTRIMLPFLTLVAVAAAFMGMLNTLGHFFIPALSPAMFNVATIVMAAGLIPFAPALGVTPIVIVAVATLVGGLGQLAIQWRPLRSEGFRYRPVLDLRDPGLHRILLLMGPGTVGLAATQINVLVNTSLATGEGSGAVSWLDYAFRIMYLPIGLFGVSIAAASTPAVSRLLAEGSTDKVRTTVGGAIALMLTLNVPATVGLAVLAPAIVSLIFEHGRFTAADTAATAAALRFYIIGLVGYSVVRIVSPTFYALRRSRVPVVASAATVAVNIGLNLMLVRVMGYTGLAFGTSIAALLNAAVQLFLLRRELDGIDGRHIASTFARISAASAVMGLAAWGAERGLHAVLPGDAIPFQLVRVAAAITTGIGVLTVTAHVLKVREFTEAASMVLGRFRRLAK